MDRKLKILISFLIGLTIRLSLEAIYPYSAIGFDPMGYYVPILYTKVNPINFIAVGPIYYYLAYFLNFFTNAPVISIKLLDSIISGIFLMALYVFSEYRLMNKHSLLLSIVAFLSFQSFILTWGLERNLLAFSLFLISLGFKNSNKKTLYFQLFILIASGFTDPAIIPLEFIFFILLSIKNKKYLPAPVALSALTILLIYLGKSSNVSRLSFMLSFFVPHNLLATFVTYAVLVLLLYLPYIFFIPYFHDIFKNKEFNLPFTFSFIISSFLVLAFFYRYLFELSTVLILLLKSPKKFKFVLILFTITILLISSSYMVMDSDNPSPYFYNTLTKESHLSHIVSTSFFQSTVPLKDSKKIVDLFSSINSNNYVVVTMLYMVSFAYEASISPNSIINTGENYSQFLYYCNYYHNLGYNVYTVWWTNNGWYGISKLHANFKPVKIMGKFALFEYGTIINISIQYSF